MNNRLNLPFQYANQLVQLIYEVSTKNINLLSKSFFSNFVIKQYHYYTSFSFEQLACLENFASGFKIKNCANFIIESLKNMVLQNKFSTSYLLFEEQANSKCSEHFQYELELSLWSFETFKSLLADRYITPLESTVHSPSSNKYHINFRQW